MTGADTARTLIPSFHEEHDTMGSRKRPPAANDRFKTLNRFLLDEYVLVHVDPTIEGVTLPSFLMKNPTVTLKISKLFRGAMTVSEQEVVADLLFNQNYFSCTVPLQAIWGMTSSGGENAVWPEAAPTEVLRSFIERGNGRSEQPRDEKAGKERPAAAPAAAPAPAAAVERSEEDVASKSEPAPSFVRPSLSISKGSSGEPSRSDGTEEKKPRPQLKRVK